MRWLGALFLGSLLGLGLSLARHRVHEAPTHAAHVSGPHACPPS